MNLKDLSISTVLLGLLYFTAFSFYNGYRGFYGFPTGFITVGIAEVVKFSVTSIGILISLLALLHLDVNEKKLPVKWAILFSVIAVLLVFGIYYVIGGGGYLFARSYKIVMGQSLLLGVVGVVGVRSVSVFVRNGFKITGQSNAVMLLGSITIIPSLLGWTWAYFPYEPLFYSKSHNAYILESYSGKYILGKCKHESASYLLVDDLNGDVIPASNKETQELKVCFLKSAKEKIPRD